MSAKSLAELALERDLEPPGKTIKSANEVLVAAVPSEALAAYTALMGIVLATNIGSRYGAFRWSAYGVFIALAMLATLVVYRRRVGALSQDEDKEDKNTRPVPVWECLVAGLAAAAWGLVMPGNPLSTVLQGDVLVFTTSGIVLGAAAIVGFAAEVLGTANSRNPLPVPPRPPVSPNLQAPATPAGIAASAVLGGGPEVPDGRGQRQGS